jgi:drug/metabolite transporter (DMT)-like permease
MPRAPAFPLWRGTLLAALAAVSFGLTTPFTKILSRGSGPFATASLLYLGAALASVGRSTSASPLGRPYLGRLVAVALLGALAAPALLAWGLQRSGAAEASLCLNFEALFTVGLAWLVFREPIGGRVLAAALLMFSGGLVVALAPGATHHGGIGLLSIVLATLAWALDNTLTRPLADLDPRAVVRAKAGLGAALSAGLSLLGGEARPPLAAALGLLVVGALGYGVSLRLYLTAQRQMGAARTGSVFALAPFVGALLSPIAGEVQSPARLLVAGLLFLGGVWLHATEGRRRHAAG